ncbi:MAG: alpha/beta hydrolase [Rubrivivax sp.]
MDALRARLPADWRVALESEPVLGGEMLTVRAGPADAPPLLLVHGLGQNGFTDWLPVMPALARDWRVLAVDLPGFGYSSMSSARLSPTQFARVLDRLLAREGRGPWTVAGHSMGGAVALRLAAESPGRVSSLVLVDVAGILHRTAFTKHMARLPLEGLPEPLKQPAERLRELGQRLVERVLGLPVDPDGVLRDNEWLWPLVMRDRSSINAGWALVDEDFSAAVYTVRQPAQIIWGEADPVAPLRTGELLARCMLRAQLHVMRGIGHTPMHQAPQDFQALLLRVLREAPQPLLPPSRRLPPVDGALPDLRCVGETDRRFGGRYREVLIERCSALRLTDLVAQRIVLRDSSVEMTGVQVRADDVALDAQRSELLATACDFSGRLAVRSDGCRLDLAGVRLAASGFALQALGLSRVVASVSEISDAWYRGWWHEDRELQRELLDPRAPLRPPAPAPAASVPPPGTGRS